MRWKVLDKRPPEDFKSDPTFSWAMDLTFYRVESLEEEEEEDELLWAASLLHRCGSPTEMNHCGIINRADTLERKAFPEYQCDKCGNKVPKNVVQEKIERQRALKGIDPRNNRRGAVLATRDSNLRNTKES